MVFLFYLYCDSFFVIKKGRTGKVVPRFSNMAILHPALRGDLFAFGST